VSVESHIVYEGDLFEFELGTEQRIRHVPNLDRDPEKPAVMRAVYAVARIVGGGVQSELMTKAEVDAIRRRSKASGSGPWVTDYTEMARKTAIRRLFKYLPVSVELCKAMELQVSAESGVFDDLEAYEDPKTQELNAKAAQAAAERAASEVKP
jgi:recombination protein RecT